MEQDLQTPKTEVLDDGFFSGLNNSSAAKPHAGKVFLFSVLRSAFESVGK